MQPRRQRRRKGRRSRLCAKLHRRLVIAGPPAARLVLARLVAGLCLALLASAAALLALAARLGIVHPGRAIAGTVMFEVIYVAVGAIVGAVARSPVNGTVIVHFVWILECSSAPRWARQTG